MLGVFDNSGKNGIGASFNDANKFKDVTLKKIYLEPTTNCNLSCKTCMRNTWDEPGGEMSMELFHHILDGLKQIPTLKEVAVWGIGEPLTHPHLPTIIQLLHQQGYRTELITNAMRLTEAMAEALILAGLDQMVVSVDSTSPDQLSEIRTGATLKKIIGNVKKLNQIKQRLNKNNPEIGIEFTVMKKNKGELKNLRELARMLEATFIVVTNVLPYSDDHKDEILYSMSVTNSHAAPRSKHNPEFFLPPIDLHNSNINDLGKISFEAMALGPHPTVTKNYEGYCPFVNRGSMAINWNGDVSPCVPLMHTYDCFVLGRAKKCMKYAFANVSQQSPLDIWNGLLYQNFRRKIIEGTFSPCIECGGCEMADSNLEDCFGNTHPTCGDCLWAKGVIQCP